VPEARPINQGKHRVDVPTHTDTHTQTQPQTQPHTQPHIHTQPRVATTGPNRTMSTSSAMAPAAAADEAPALSAEELSERLASWRSGVSADDAWYTAAMLGAIDVCKTLKALRAHGINRRHDNGLHRGRTPLLVAMLSQEEKTARWLMRNGANLAAADDKGFTIFSWACACSSPALVEELASMVPPGHLTQENDEGAGTATRRESPLFRATHCGVVDDGVEIVRMLTLRGVPLRREDFEVAETQGPSDIEVCRQLLYWVQGELELHATFRSVVLGCGVHGSDDLPPAQRSSLRKLRGIGGASERIAQYVGVRVGVDLQRLHRAAQVWEGVVSSGEDITMKAWESEWSD